MLSREASVGVGLATGALVWGIYQIALPSAVDVRSAPANDADIAATERTAAWTAATVVAGVSLITKDPTVFVIGGTMIIALSWWMRHCNVHSPNLGAGVTPQQRVMSEDVAASYGPAAGR